MHKIKTHHQHPEGKIFAWMALLLYLGISFIFPIFPNFVKQIVKQDDYVSLFYAAMAIMILLAAIASTIVFKKIDRAKITKWGFFISGITFFLLIFISRITELTVIRTIQVCVNLFILMSISLFVRDFATSRNLGEKEGQYYKYSNIGVFFGPLIGGFVAANLGYELTFIMAAVILFCGFGYFYGKHSLENNPAIITLPKMKTSSFIKNIKDNFSSPGRVRAYFITLILTLWFGFRNLYIPLYIVEQGFLENVSGIVMALSIIPFILLEVGVGKYAEKKGIRMPISIGFLIIGIDLLLVFICPFSIVNFGLLILGNIGASFIEPLQEYTLFKNLPKEDEDRIYGVHMTANPIGFFLAPAIGGIILTMLSFEYIFLFFGIIMLFASGVFWLKLQHQ
ncbi:MAG: MFS transporter [Candidatus Gracilibacteria bacterium]|jgi:MFS family permease